MNNETRKIKNYFNKVNFQTMRLQESYRKSGPPLFAKMAILFIIGVALCIAFGTLYRERENRAGKKREGSIFKKNPPTRKIDYSQLDAQALHLRAKSLIKEGKYKAAEIEAQRALRVNNTFYKAYIDLGVAYSSYGDYVRAEQVYKTALNYIGGSTFDLEIIYADLGRVYYAERNSLLAWEYFRKAYELKSHLGNDFWSDPRLKYVVENEKNKFIEQLANDKRVPREISQRRKEIEKLISRNADEAIANCEQFIADNPGSVYTYIIRSQLVSALLRKGENNEAFAQLKIVESENPSDSYIAWTKHMYAYFYDKKGEAQRAADYLRDIIANYPNYESIGEVKEMLNRLESNG